jgi:hypothetical protein
MNVSQHQRVENRMRELKERGPVEAVCIPLGGTGPEVPMKWWTMICDGCGRRVDASGDALPEALSGWRLGRYGEGADFCPECVRREEEEVPA